MLIAVMRIQMNDCGSWKSIALLKDVVIKVTVAGVTLVVQIDCGGCEKQPTTLKRVELDEIYRVTPSELKEISPRHKQSLSLYTF